MNSITVAAMLILYGILFIVIENYNKKRKPEVVKLSELSYKRAPADRGLSGLVDCAGNFPIRGDHSGWDDPGDIANGGR